MEAVAAAAVIVVMAVAPVLRSRHPLSSPLLELSEVNTEDLFDLPKGGLEPELVVATKVGGKALGDVEVVMVAG